MTSPDTKASLVGPYESTDEDCDESTTSNRSRKRRKRVAAPLAAGGGGNSQLKSLLRQAPVPNDVKSGLESLDALEKLLERHPRTDSEPDDAEYVLDLSTLQLAPAPILRPKAAREADGDDVTPGPSTSSDGDGDGDGGQIFLKPKPRCRKFIFKPFKRLESGELAHDETKEAVHVTIPEQLAASYGLYIWPCAPVLAWYVWLHQDQFEVFRQHSCLNLKMPKQISFKYLDTRNP